MRTDKKYKVIGAFAGAGIGATLCLTIQKKKLQHEGKELSWQNLDGWQLFLWTAIGGFLGANAGDLLYKFRAFHDEPSSFSPGNFLGSLLIKESINSDPTYFNLVSRYRNTVKEALNSMFGSMLVDRPLDAGSLKNRTAIASDYDVDIILPFRKNAFASLALMHDCVYSKLKTYFGDHAEIVKSRRTIGITFRVDNHEVRFDIAPGREIRNFKKDGLLNMYVAADSFFGSESSQKINAKKQLVFTENKAEARDVIRLLKLYSIKNKLDIPSVIITQATLRAMKPTLFGTEPSRKENLLNAMAYLSERLNAGSLIDFSNSNVNLLEKMNESNRYEAADLLKSDIAKIEKDQLYISEIFKE